MQEIQLKNGKKLMTEKVIGCQINSNSFPTVQDLQNKICIGRRFSYHNRKKKIFFNSPRTILTRNEKTMGLSSGV